MLANYRRIDYRVRLDWSNDCFRSTLVAGAFNLEGRFCAIRVLALSFQRGWWAERRA